MGQSTRRCRDSSYRVPARAACRRCEGGVHERYKHHPLRPDMRPEDKHNTTVVEQIYLGKVPHVPEYESVKLTLLPDSDSSPEAKPFFNSRSVPKGVVKRGKRTLRSERHAWRHRVHRIGLHAVRGERHLRCVALR